MSNPRSPSSDASWSAAGSCSGLRSPSSRRSSPRGRGPLEGIGVGSGTDALILGLKSLGIGPGDEVIVPAFTAFPTVAAVLDIGACPVIVDVEEHRPLLDLDATLNSISERTKAVVLVHLYGVFRLTRMHSLRAPSSRGWSSSRIARRRRVPNWPRVGRWDRSAGSGRSASTPRRTWVRSGTGVLSSPPTRRSRRRYGHGGVTGSVPSATGTSCPRGTRDSTMSKPRCSGSAWPTWIAMSSGGDPSVSGTPERCPRRSDMPHTVQPERRTWPLSGSPLPAAPVRTN